MEAERDGDSKSSKVLDEILLTTDVMFGLISPLGITRRAPHLKWFQSYSTGVDRLLSDEELKKSSVVITNVSGFHDVAISEYVLETILMFVKDTQRCFRQKLERRWEWFPVDTLDSKTIGIVGYGRIGRAVAKLSKAFNMQTMAIDRSDYISDPDHWVDNPLPSQRLKELMETSDFVVVCLPLTPETRGLLGKKELEFMRKDARLIVVSRGSIVDEQALFRALNERRIAGAALDVFAEEPLPPSSPLWSLENLIFSPHNSGDIKDYDGKTTVLFCENLKRYLSGQDLLNVVNKELGF
ncbi:D-2-hydroxyacid dehydrogenase [Chloroflexota bacterium]